MKERCCCKGFLCGSVKSFAQVPWECVQLLFIGSTWLIAKYLAFEGMTRRSQDASPDELRKVLRIHVPNAPALIFFSLSVEQQIVEQEELLKEMLLLSSRPTVSWVIAACKQVWQKCDYESVTKFAKAMVSCSQHCFQKSLQATSGAKLSAPVKRLVQVIRNSSTRPLSFGDKLVRKLKRVSWL